MSTFKEGMKACRKFGTAHATGDGLRAMYAKLVAGMHGGKPEKYFAHLQKHTADNDITEAARVLLRDRQAAWDVLIE